MSPRNEVINAWLSTMPVDGEWSAATAFRARLELPCLGARRSATSPTPFSSAIDLIASMRDTRPAEVATTNFPHLRWAMPRSAQYAYRARAPRVHRRAFNEPGA